jgi:hypothetical protein
VQVPKAVCDPSVHIDGCNTAWYEMQALSSLNLSQNCLEALPDELHQLESLQVLNASRNELQKLPSAVTQMSALKLLDVSSNQCDPTAAAF